MGAVDRHPQTVQPQIVGEGRLDQLHVAPGSPVQPPHAAKLIRLGQREIRAFVGHARDAGFDLCFDRVAELVALRAEQLDAIVVEGIVRG